MSLTRYPHPVRPYPHETRVSYRDRLVAAQGETSKHWRHLHTQFQADHPELAGDDVELALLQVKTGRTRFPFHPEPHWAGPAVPAPGLPARWVCTHCTHRQTVETVPHLDGFLCQRHRRWAGPGTRPEQQHPVTTEVLAAERRYQRLRRAGRISVNLYQSVATALSFTGADSHAYPAFVRVLDLLTSTEFSRAFYSPATPYAAAFAHLSSELTRILGADAAQAARALWLRERHRFLTIREHLDTGEPFTSEVLTRLGLPAGGIPERPQVMRPLEPFIRYLHVTGDHIISRENVADVLIRAHVRMTDDTGLPTRTVLTICRNGHRVEVKRNVLYRHAGRNTDLCPFCRRRKPLVESPRV